MREQELETFSSCKLWTALAKQLTLPNSSKLTVQFLPFELYEWETRGRCYKQDTFPIIDVTVSMMSVRQ